MSEYLGQILSSKLNLNQDAIQLFTKSLRSLNRPERKLLYGELSTTLTQVESTLLAAWEQADDEERAKWLNVTVESIVTHGGDRDMLDKLATQLIGSLKVYNLVQKLSTERGILLKVSASQGGCTFILLAIILILGLVLAYINLM